MHGGVVLRALMRSEGLVTLARARGSWKGYRCPGLAEGCASDRDCFGVAVLAVGVLRGVPARLTVVLGTYVCDLRLHHTCLSPALRPAVSVSQCKCR